MGAIRAIIEAFMNLFAFAAGRRTAKGDAARDTNKRVEKGRDAVRDIGDDPSQQLRDNEGRW